MQLVSDRSHGDVRDEVLAVPGGVLTTLCRLRLQAWVHEAFLWFRSFAVKKQSKNAVRISGLVAFIAAMVM
jgi:hypothetical protein